MRLIIHPVFRFAVIILTITGFFGCKCTPEVIEKEPEPLPPLSAPVCTDSLRPIVMVHGMLASGDTYAKQAIRFRYNHYCSDRLFVLDWNTTAGLGGGSGNSEAELDSLIDAVLTLTGSDKVDLMGHSAGSGMCYTYLSKPENAAKVAHYAHLAGNAEAQPAGPAGEIPTLNVYSDGDAAVQGGEIPGATNLRLTDEDHYQVATGATTFDALFRLFNDNKIPKTDPIPTEKHPEIAGRVVTLGENKPKAGAQVKIYALQAETGARVSDTPLYDLLTDAQGYWKGAILRPDTYYEFQVIPAETGDRKVIYYREKFSQSDQFVYLRTVPPSGSVAGLLLNGIPKNDAESAFAIFTANQAVTSGRDVLSIDNDVLSTPQFTPASRTNIAMFLYDDGDSQTELTQHFIFSLYPTFLNGLDYYVGTATPQTVSLQFNGRTLHVPNRKSDSEGIVVVVFD
ncbi:MAG: hypothetical protein K1X92_18750 [Bacteroidia bacterium]|nr:hypothetical protein [Bacteroidia bacterium]